MADYSGMILTNNGIALQVKAEAGAVLNFTKVKIGDGQLADGQTLQELNDLINPLQEANITSVQALTGGQCRVRANVTNEGVLQGFYVREVGLFAQDPDAGEILYAIATSTSADFLPAEGGATAVNNQFDIIVVVGNASQITAVISVTGYALLTDFNAHLAEKASQSILGHVKVGSGVTIDSNGVLSAPGAMDNGRYQAEFDWDEILTENCFLLDGSVILDGLSQQIDQDTGTTVSELIYANNGVGQRLDESFTANIKVINWVDIYVSSIAAITLSFRCMVYDETDGVVLGTKTILNTSVIVGYNRFVFSVPISIVPGHVIQLRFDQNGDNDSAHYIRVFKTASDVQSGSSEITTTDLWSTKTINNVADLRYKINADIANTIGTVTKTITPSDLKTWGNLKWTQNTPVNTSVVCDVLDALDNVLKAGVTSITDIPDIDITTHPSLKIRWTLTRNSVEDETPTVSDQSVTWEGAGVKVQVASGTFSDTSTVISAGATYVKIIPLPFTASRGKLFISNGSASHHGAIIFFDIYINNTFGFSDATYGSTTDFFNMYYGSNGVTGNFLDIYSYIRVKSVYINGNNLEVIFENTVAELATLSIVFAKWEVEC